MLSLSTFKTFLTESYKGKKLKDELNRILKLNKERGANPADLILIPSNFKEFTKISKIDATDKMEQARCYDNALTFSRTHDLPLVIGLFIDVTQMKDNVDWMDSSNDAKFNPWYFVYPHAWNLDKKGNVYDVTLDHPNPVRYFGVVVDYKKFKKGFGDLSDYLRTLIDNKK